MSTHKVEELMSRNVAVINVKSDVHELEKLLLENIAAIGENIVIRRFERWELGESASND